MPPPALRQIRTLLAKQQPTGLAALKAAFFRFHTDKAKYIHAEERTWPVPPALLTDEALRERIGQMLLLSEKGHRTLMRAREEPSKKDNKTQRRAKKAPKRAKARTASFRDLDLRTYEAEVEQAFRRAVRDLVEGEWVEADVIDRWKRTVERIALNTFRSHSPALVSELELIDRECARRTFARTLARALERR